MRTLLSLLALTGLLTGGCATMMTRNFPKPLDSLTIGLSNDKPGYRSDWPSGAYEIPNTNIYVSTVNGDQDVSGAQFLFGIIGRELAGGAIAGGAKDKMNGQESALDFDLNAMTDDALKRVLAKSKDTQRFSIEPNAKASSVLLTPYVVFSHVDDNNARMWVVLNVELRGEEPWYCRYLAGVGKPRPMSGPGSWTENKGEAAGQLIGYNLDRELEVMFYDFDGKLRNPNVPLAYYNGKWMFYRTPQPVEVQVLKQTDYFDVVLPQIGDGQYFSGVNILPKDFNEPAQP
jgi:hypothetical protein